MAMWDDIVKHLVDFPSVVVTSVDSDGYPFSVRCKPRPDNTAQVLLIQLPESAGIQPGPAGLLCHKHDEWLWNLKSFIVRGTLEQDAQGWILNPHHFTPGAGIGGLIGMVKFLRDGRRATKRYLDKHGLARPSIPWDKLHAVWADVKRTK